MKKNKKRLRPDIFVFHDYRAFLKEWFSYLKEVFPDFSLRSLARETGLASGYFPMVLSGKRKLSSKALAKCATALHLSATEKSYLDLLLVLADEVPDETRVDAFERIQRYRGYQEVHPQETEAYKYLSHWYYVAIREMALLPDFRLDAKWIQSRLQAKVSVREIEHALEFLLKAKLIEPQKSGGAKATRRAVECIGGIYRLALGAFHRQALHLASEAIGNLSPKERAVMGYTMPVAGKDYAEVLKILEKAKNEIAKLEDASDPKNKIYHVAFAVFPLTKGA